MGYHICSFMMLMIGTIMLIFPMPSCQSVAWLASKALKFGMVSYGAGMFPLRKPASQITSRELKRGHLFLVVGNANAGICIITSA